MRLLRYELAYIHGRLNYLAMLVAIVESERRERLRMSAQGLRQALRHLPGAHALTVQALPDGRQAVTVAGRTVQVDSAASPSDIAAALANPFIQPETRHMSITGFQPGAIRAAIDAAKQKSQADLDAAMVKLSAAQTKAASVPDAITALSVQMEKEADDALQELAQFTNGGPA